KTFQQEAVHRRERQVSRFVEREPPESLAFERRRNAAPSCAIVKQQDNARAAVIARLFGKSERPHRHRIERQSKLLAHLSNQCKSRSFLAFHLPARKLPLPGVALAGKRRLQQQPVPGVTN